jgi:hypothetical protein
MTSARSLAFPGSRVVAGWWRQLASLQPRTIWVAHLLMHRVEALVRLNRRCRLDRVQRLLLTTLARESQLPVNRLAILLPLDGCMLRQLLVGLQADGLTTQGPDAAWQLTELGRAADSNGEYPRSTHERRAFHFLQHNQSNSSPTFVHLANASAVPWPAAEGWAFDHSLLKKCLHRPAEWKQRHGFPQDVEEIVDAREASPTSGSVERGGATPEWQRVILDHPEQLMACFVTAPNYRGEERLIGFPVQQQGWKLNSGTRIVDLAGKWQEDFPDLASDPPVEIWRQALSTWGQAHGVTAGEAAACPVERRQWRLRVTLAPSVLDRLKASKSEAIKGESWLLAGDDRYRAAACLEFIQAN